MAADGKRGLAHANKATRQAVAQAGGLAKHPKGRGMQNVPEWKRKQIASLGGLARKRSQDEAKKASKKPT